MAEVEFRIGHKIRVYSRVQNVTGRWTNEDFLKILRNTRIYLEYFLEWFRKVSGVFQCKRWLKIRHTGAVWGAQGAFRLAHIQCTCKETVINSFPACSCGGGAVCIWLGLCLLYESFGRKPGWRFTARSTYWSSLGGPRGVRASGYPCTCKETDYKYFSVHA